MRATANFAPTPLLTSQQPIPLRDIPSRLNSPYRAKTRARTYPNNLSAALAGGFLVMRQRKSQREGLRDPRRSLPRSCIARFPGAVPEPRGSADASISPQIGRYIFG